jgi:hypothetical protein
MYQIQTDPTEQKPPPRHRGGLVLFLDFDGTLHPASVYRHPKQGVFLRGAPGHTLFEHAELLARLLEPYPTVKIVLSTSWIQRYEGSIPHVSRKLPSALRKRIIGATFHGRMDPVVFSAMPRGWQIWSDVTRRHPSAWIALDDDDAGWPEWCRDHLVLCDPTLGISVPAVLEELERKLAEMHRQTR